MSKKFAKHPVSVGGKTWPSIAEAAKELGLTRQALWMRLHRMPPEDALRDEAGRQIVRKRKSCRFVLVDGEPMTVAQCAKRFRVTADTVFGWIRTRRIQTYGEPRRCSHCKQPGHRFNTCPELYLRGTKKGHVRPPGESALRAAGIPPKGPPGEGWL